MANASTLPDGSRGRISHGPSDNLTQRTLEFVCAQLPRWRDDPNRKSEFSEEALNAQLCKFLNVAARNEFPMVYFHHEERQTGRRRVDLSALPTRNLLIGSTYRSIYDPFFVLEGKRLPAPTGTREREYVTGGADKSGGIQRFKLGLHGANVTDAGMIGYVQSGTFASWLVMINNWISELTTDPTVPDERWSDADKLADFSEREDVHTATLSSEHRRANGTTSPNIRIRHLWVEISPTTRS